MKVLSHHIYEYKKGIRKLILHTLNASFRPQVEAKLKHHGIDYIIREVSPTKMNIFFGSKECVELIRCFGNKKLNEFTPEEDFILGTLLGYDSLQQCRRYLQKVADEKFSPGMWVAS